MAEQPEDAPTDPLAFTPVPRLIDRSDGWMPHIQQSFIEALADTGSVAAACRMVDRSPCSAYQLRRHPEAGEFAAAWAAAIGHGVLRLQDAVMDRALNGVEVPLIYHGEVVGYFRKYDDRLAAFILRNHLPEQYGADGERRVHAIDRRKLERLKREWREEWEAERLAAERREDAETIESLDAFFEGLRQRRLANEAILAEAAHDEDDDGDEALTAGEQEALPEPEPQPRPRPEPRIRTLKDGGW